MKLGSLILCLLLVTVAWSGAQSWKVLVLAGNQSQNEFPELSKFTQIEGVQFTYEQTADRTLPGLDSANILWIGQGEICENAYFFDAAIEDKIKSFVEGGGVVISVGQDSDTGRPCESGWFPASVLGIERGGTESFAVTQATEVGELFSKPNAVQQIHFDDAWTNPDPSITLLATINNDQDVGIGLLPHGKGYYLITSIENESTSDVATNVPIMENLLLYAASLLAQATPVEPQGKLAVAWSYLKME